MGLKSQEKETKRRYEKWLRIEGHQCEEQEKLEAFTYERKRGAG